MTKVSGISAGVPSAPKVRKANSVSEKRKQQNRQSSRTYREKQKKRIEALELLASSVNPPDSQSSNEHRTLPEQLEHSPEQSKSDIQNQPSRTEAFDTSPPVNLNETQTDLLFDFDNAISNPNPNFSLDGDLMLDENSGSTGPSNTLSRLYNTLSPNSTIEFHSLFENSATIGSSEQQSLARDLDHFFGTHSETWSMSQADPRIIELDPSDNTEASGSSMTVETHGDGLILANFGSYSTRLHMLGLPSPRSNFLRLNILTFINAIKANALLLGFSEHMLCGEGSVSPFYRPCLTESAYQTQIVTTVQNIFQSIKKDLRPSPMQITTSHHPFIDIYPFPHMRERLIEHLAHDPPLVDEDEFFYDCLNGGLICWGDMSPAKGVSPLGNGTPWDMRSWEAQPWFLKKWVSIVGGPDDELYGQSRWWREMRGDDEIVL
ncbi:hypothetical protein B7463_g9488, partial [Scytalidium lignicola]